MVLGSKEVIMAFGILSVDFIVDFSFLFLSFSYFWCRFLFSRILHFNIISMTYYTRVWLIISRARFLALIVCYRHVLIIHCLFLLLFFDSLIRFLSISYSLVSLFYHSPLSLCFHSTLFSLSPLSPLSPLSSLSSLLNHHRAYIRRSSWRHQRHREQLRVLLRHHQLPVELHGRLISRATGAVSAQPWKVIFVFNDPSSSLLIFFLLYWSFFSLFYSVLFSSSLIFSLFLFTFIQVFDLGGRKHCRGNARWHMRSEDWPVLRQRCQGMPRQSIAMRGLWTVYSRIYIRFASSSAICLSLFSSSNAPIPYTP